MMFNINDKRFPRQENMEANFEFKPLLKSLETQVRSAPTMDELRGYLPDLVMHTWEKHPYEMLDAMSKEDKDRLIYRVFRGKMLPTALNSINIVMTINNISGHAVTHLTRHRQLNLSADCTGDKDMNERTVLIPDAFYHDETTLENYKHIATQQMEEYVRIRNTWDFAHVDARMLLPRSIATFYTAAGFLPAYMGLIRDRKDTQVQPYEDNVLAYRVAQSLWRWNPLLATTIKLDNGSPFFQMESRTNFASQFYMPEPVNNPDNLLSEDPEDYLFQKRRDELKGDSEWQAIKAEVLADQEVHDELAHEMYPHVFESINDWR